MGGRLVFDQWRPDPNNPHRAHGLQSLVWAGLTEDERAGVRAKTLQMRPGGGVEAYEKKPVVYGKRFLRWTVSGVTMQKIGRKSGLLHE